MIAPERLVVDTSVAAKWYLPEERSAEATAILARGAELMAPDLIVSELGDILWKRVRSGMLMAAEAHEVAQAFVLHCPLAMVPSHSLLDAALEIAINCQHSVYDALYVALAVAQDARLVTDDARLGNAVRATPLAPFVVLLTEF